MQNHVHLIFTEQMYSVVITYVPVIKGNKLHCPAEFCVLPSTNSISKPLQRLSSHIIVMLFQWSMLEECQMWPMRCLLSHYSITGVTSQIKSNTCSPVYIGESNLHSKRISLAACLYWVTILELQFLCRKFKWIIKSSPLHPAISECVLHNTRWGSCAVTQCTDSAFLQTTRLYADKRLTWFKVTIMSWSLNYY